MTHLPPGSPSPSGPISSQPQSQCTPKATMRATRSALARNAGSFLFAVVLLLLGSVVRPVQAQTLVPGWNQLSPPNSPPERYIHAMTYDAGHGQVVLFGGFGQINPFYLNDTWLWNGSNWTQANPTVSPDPRAAHALVYDAAHNKVVLFGGTSSSTNRFGDTWTWDGTNWTNVTPPTRRTVLRRAMRPSWSTTRRPTTLFCSEGAVRAISATRGRGTERTGQCNSTSPGTVQAPGLIIRWFTTPRTARSCYSAAVTVRVSQRHLDLERNNLDSAEPCNHPARARHAGNGL